MCTIAARRRGTQTIPAKLMNIDQAFSTAIQLHQAGDLRRAAQLYQQILAAAPDHPPALANLALILISANQPDISVQLCQRALALQPAFADASNTLGMALAQLGQRRAAIDAFRKACQLNPDSPAMLANLGKALLDAGEAADAAEAYRRAAKCDPRSAEIASGLGCALLAQDKVEEAIAMHRLAIQLRPQYAEAIGNLGSAIQEKGLLQEAISLYEQALAIQPSLVEAHCDMGTALFRLGKFPDAEAAFERAIALAPNHARAHFNLGSLRLLHGDYQRGWPDYEWRLQIPQIQKRAPQLPQPSRWDGAALAGRTLLLYCEQGLGDSIQFARYIPLVQQLGAAVTLRCPAPLQTLFRESFPGCEVEPDSTAPSWRDLHCPLLSLPLILKHLAPQQIPAQFPYLRSDPQRTRSWAERLSNIQAKRKVGLIWAGGAKPPGRSVQLNEFAPLAEVEDVQLISLQHGPQAAQADHAPSTMNILHWTDQLMHFSDSAGLMQNLDLVISIDTAGAHLAGAMGIPVWICLLKIPDWRWQLHRTDSAWYPTARLFRQTTPGDFAAPIREMAQLLRTWSPL